MGGEQHTGQRNFLNHKCWIVQAEGQPGIAAHISNVSKTGARLVFQSPETIPDEFTLILTQDGQVCRRCCVVQRQGSDIEITFVHGHRNSVEASTDSSWFKRLAVTQA